MNLAMLYSKKVQKFQDYEKNQKIHLEKLKQIKSVVKSFNSSYGEYKMETNSKNKFRLNGNLKRANEHN